jgi:hypothetical protein
VAELVDLTFAPPGTVAHFVHELAQGNYITNPGRDSFRHDGHFDSFCLEEPGEIFDMSLAADEENVLSAHLDRRFALSLLYIASAKGVFNQFIFASFTAMNLFRHLLWIHLG